MNTVNLNAERASRRSFVARDVIAATGITYRQLDYWTRTGLVDSSGHEATGSGDVRWYRENDVVRIATISALLNAGLSLAGIRDDIDALLAESGTIQRGTTTITVDLDRIRQRIDAYRRRAS